jgi:hypothetical protein
MMENRKIKKRQPAATADPHSRIIAPEAPATQPSPLKVQNRAVMLHEGRLTDTPRSGAGARAGSRSVIAPVLRGR